MKLQDAAKALGVELDENACLLEIAHEVLAKLNGDIGIHWTDEDQWRAYWSWPQDDDERTGTFIECVTALAERYLTRKTGVPKAYCTCEECMRGRDG